MWCPSAGHMGAYKVVEMGVIEKRKNKSERKKGTLPAEHGAFEKKWSKNTPKGGGVLWGKRGTSRN